MAGTPIFTLEPNPHWVIIDNFSKLPDGAAIYTYRHLDPSTFKPAFKDAAGMIPYGQPIVGFGNGTMPPIFWEFDPNNPTDTYYIRVYDKEIVSGGDAEFLWDFDGLSGGGSGGGGTVITATNLENLVVNNIFYRNLGSQAGTPSLPTFLTIAPSNNAGYVTSTLNSNGFPAPDITFQKNNTVNSDSLSFTDFTPLGIMPLIGDITPQLFVNYTCTTNIGGETYKYIQFPIDQGVQPLSNQIVTIRFWAQYISGDPNISLYWRQFYGDGGGSPEQRLLVSGTPLTLNPDGNWHVYNLPSQVPDADTNTPGACGNDALFLQIQYPLGLATNINFIKPAVYLGTVAPGIDFVSNDEVDAIVNSPRTGDVRISLNSVILGWVIMNDGSIGSITSNATTRANIDTFPLYSLIWNLFQPNQALAPMYSSANLFTPIAYGANPSTDFVAGNSISLTRALGRVMAGTVPVQTTQAFIAAASVITVPSTANYFTGVPIIVTGGGIPVALVANKTYYVKRLSGTTLALYPSAQDADANTNIIIFGAGNGNILTPAHTIGNDFGSETAVGQGFVGTPPTTFIDPTVYMNFFMKL